MEISWNLDLANVSSRQKWISPLSEHGLGVEALVWWKGRREKGQNYMKSWAEIPGEQGSCFHCQQDGGTGNSWCRENHSPSSPLPWPFEPFHQGSKLMPLLGNCLPCPGQSQPCCSPSVTCQCHYAGNNVTWRNKLELGAPESQRNAQLRINTVPLTKTLAYFVTGDASWMKIFLFGC